MAGRVPMILKPKIQGLGYITQICQQIRCPLDQRWPLLSSGLMRINGKMKTLKCVFTLRVYRLQRNLRLFAISDEKLIWHIDFSSIVHDTKSIMRV